MINFWKSVLDDLIFQHCDGEGLNDLLKEWLDCDDFTLEWTHNGFELSPWDEFNQSRLEFVYRDGQLSVYDEEYDLSLVEHKIGKTRFRAIELILKEIFIKEREQCI